MSVYLESLTDKSVIDYQTSFNQSKPFVCFDRLTMGMSSLGFHQNAGEHRGLDFKLYRDYVLKRLGISPRISCDEFTVLIHEKKGRRSVLNLEEVTEHLKKELPLAHKIPVNISLVTLDALTASEMLQTVSNADVFLSAGGSALFTAIMMHDGSVIIGNTLWGGRKDLFDSEFRILSHVPYILYQIHPLKSEQVNMEKGGSTWDVQESLTELRRAIQYSYEYKKKYYCPSWI